MKFLMAFNFFSSKIFPRLVLHVIVNFPRLTKQLSLGYCEDFLGNIWKYKSINYWWFLEEVLNRDGRFHGSLPPSNVFMTSYLFLLLFLKSPYRSYPPSTGVQKVLKLRNQWFETKMMFPAEFSIHWRIVRDHVIWESHWN